MTTARIVLEADSRGIKTAANDLDHLSARAGNAEKAGSNLGRSFANAAKIIGAGLIIRSVIKNTIEQERVTAQLEATLKSTGHAAGLNKQELLDMAAGMQQVTTFGDEAVIGAQNLLLTFKEIGKDVFPRALESVLDLSTGMGQDLKSSSIQLGKALNDPIKGVTALTRVGVDFNDAQKDMIKSLVESGNKAEAQKIILAELETQFGGSARAARNTLGGALKSLQNAFGDLLEGESGVGAATDSINQLTDTLNDPQVKAGFQTMVSGILSVISVAAKAIPVLMDFSRFVGEAIAARVSGPAFGDLPRIEDAIDRQMQLVENLRGMAQASRGADAAQFTARLKTAQDKLDRLTTLYRLSVEANNEIAKAPPPEVKVPKIDTSGIFAGEIDKEADKLRAAIDRQIASLQLQAATLGMSEKAAALYRLEIQGAAPDQLALAGAALEAVDAFEKQAKVAEDLARTQEDLKNQGVALFNETRTPIEQLGNELARLQAILDAGETDFDTYSRGVFRAQDEFDRLTEKVEETGSVLDDFSKTAAASIQGTFADFFKNTEDGFKGLGRSFALLVQDMLAQAAAAQLTRTLFGEGGTGGGALSGALSAFGSFLGFKNSGGIIPSGSFAIAGERSPEIVRGPATVTSAADTAKMLGGGNNFSFHMPGITNAREAKQASAHMEKAAVDAMRKAQRYA